MEMMFDRVAHRGFFEQQGSYYALSRSLLFSGLASVFGCIGHSSDCGIVLRSSCAFNLAECSITTTTAAAIGAMSVQFRAKSASASRSRL